MYSGNDKKTILNSPMKADFKILWNNCLNVIRDNISEAAFNTWFAPITPLSYQDNVLTIQVPSQFFYEYLEEKYIDLIQQTLYREIGEGTILNYRVLIETETNTAVELRGEPRAQQSGDKKLAKKIAIKVPNPFERVETPEFDSQINSKYTFNNFFEGESNRLARTAAEAVAENPAKTAFNPLFVYGNSGVGKTHLCHAIGSKILDKYPERKVLYLSAHLFKVQFTDARRFNTINDFINFYQGIDVLIIDDIQELSGLEKTQNTFFHIFNHLHQQPIGATHSQGYSVERSTTAYLRSRHGTADGYQPHPTNFAASLSFFDGRQNHRENGQIHHWYQKHYGQRALFSRALPRRAHHARRIASGSDGTNGRFTRPLRTGRTGKVFHLFFKNRQRQIPSESGSGRYAYFQGRTNE